MPKPPRDPDPITDDAKRVAPLHGGDRGGLGENGWVEVPEDRVGGHPQLETHPRTGPDGLLNGPQPALDPETGAASEDDLA